MDSLYFYIILRFRRLSEASSSRSIRRINGDNEFYSIYPNGKGYILSDKRNATAKIKAVLFKQ